MVYNWLQLEDSSLHEFALKSKRERQLWLKRFCLKDGEVEGLYLHHDAGPLPLGQLDPPAPRQLIELRFEERGGRPGLVSGAAGGQQQSAGNLNIQNSVLAEN